MSLLTCIGNGHFSYLSWAFKYATLLGVTAARQAFFKRTTDALVVFIEKVLEQAFSLNFPQNGPFAYADLFAPFTAVLLQDSTNFHLPDSLLEAFPGNYSRGKRKAVVKVDTILDLKRWTIKRWEIRSFCQNDQSNATRSLTGIKPGSLLIRDLGYFTLEALQELYTQNIHFLYRLKNGISIHCPDTHQRITLSRALSKTRTTSLEVLLGVEKVPVRLVAIPLDPATSEYRRRQARKNRDRRLKPNHEHMQRLGWALFITSVPEEVWSDKQVEQAYKVRWNIELLFKVWKSNTPVVKSCNRNLSSETRVRMLLIAMLLYTFLVIIPILHSAQSSSTEHSISWTKLLALIRLQNLSSIDNETLRIMLHYAKYEKRQRKNIIQKLELLE